MKRSETINPDTTIKELTKSAEAGDRIAQRQLAIYYTEKAPDVEKELFWWKKAAEQNDPVALHHLGSICEEQGNLDEARDFYLREKVAEETSEDEEMKKLKMAE